MDEKTQNEVAALTKQLLKELITKAMENENKDARMMMLPHILEGLDLFELRKLVE